MFDGVRNVKLCMCVKYTQRPGTNQDQILCESLLQAELITGQPLFPGESDLDQVHKLYHENPCNYTKS